MCSEHMNVAQMFMILRKLAENTENYVFQRIFFDQMPSHTQNQVKELNITYSNTWLMIK